MTVTALDHGNLFGSFLLPTSSLEIRTSVGTGSITFSASLNPQKGYFIACYGANGAVTVGANSLTVTDGTGSSQGIPVTEGAPFPFVAQGTTLRFRTLSGSADVFLWEAVRGE